ncbi:MAG: hypothetical protein ACMUIL_01040 [bacterium]
MGTIRDKISGDPIKAWIMTDGGILVSSSSDGTFMMVHPAGYYKFLIYRDGYFEKSFYFDVQELIYSPLNIELSAFSSFGTVACFINILINAAPGRPG